MGAVENLCFSGVYLSEGRLFFQGTISAVIKNYIGGIEKNLIVSSKNVRDIPRRSEEGTIFRFTNVTIMNGSRSSLWEPLQFSIEFTTLKDVISICPGIEVYRIDGSCIFSCDSEDSGISITAKRGVTKEVEVEVPHPNLSPGQYYLRVVARSGNTVVDWLDNVISFEIETNKCSLWSTLPHLGMRPQSFWKI